MTASTANSFPIGTRVVLGGLTKAPQYNGKTGVVKSYLNDDGRQHVYVSDLSKTMALRTSNLTYEPRSADTLSVKELKTVIKAKSVQENVTGMDVADLRNIVSRHTDSAEEIAGILAKANAETSKASATMPSMNRDTFQSQVDAVSQMTPEQLKQQAQAMRAMDPATIRRMNPQLAGMTDEQIRAAADQMETMASNPSMFQMAKNQMKNMNPEQLEQHYNTTTGGGTASVPSTAPPQTTMPASADQFQSQLGNMSPEQLKRQAQAMKGMDPAMIRSMNPQLAGMSDEQIKAAMSQMETMASNPEMFNMMKDQLKNMSPEQLEVMKQQQQSGASPNLADPSKILENMDSKQVKQMMEMVKKNPALMKQAMASNPAMAGMSEEQLNKGLDMFSQMDDKQLERAIGMMNRIQKVTKPVSSAWARVNGWFGGYLARILLFFVVMAVSSAIWNWLSGSGTDSLGTDPFVEKPVAESVPVTEQQDEFGGEF